MSKAISAEQGSFRDPSGQVFVSDDRVYRTVMPVAKDDYDFVRSASVWGELIDEGLVLPEKKVHPSILGELAQGATYVLEHPKIPCISYPYEWCFYGLKEAALLHLDLHLRALDNGITLSDATAYNIQFIGSKPIFIDHLSFRKYREGEFWMGHRQFCEQFLNPLLLRSKLGIPHNAWYRGTLEGIDIMDMNRLLPWNKKLSWKMISNIVLQARFQKSGIQGSAQDTGNKQRRLPIEGFRFMLKGLRSWIKKLEPADTGKTVWGDYAVSNSYLDKEQNNKKQFIAQFTASTKAKIVWDIGCNTGDYSRAAIEGGAKSVVGFDFDQIALEAGFKRAQKEKLPFLPLFMDAANPSPDQGWAESERSGMLSRATPDAIIALAIVHHLAISRNVPLGNVIDWLMSMAPAGVIEFIPKSDPMVQELLRLREDIFDQYTEDVFLAAIASRAQITDQEKVSSTGRLLVSYRR